MDKEKMNKNRKELTDAQLSVGDGCVKTMVEGTGHKVTGVSNCGVHNETTIINYNLPEPSSTQNDPRTTNSSLEPAPDALTAQLKKMYSRITLPHVTWLGNKQDFVMSHYYVTLQLTSGLEKKNKSIGLDQIFAESEGKFPNRLLIEGQPGYGETTLTHKVVYDWAKGENYLSRFNRAFVIPLRLLKGQRLENAIKTICTKSDFKKPFEVEDFNKEDTLLILDGFDELDSKFHEDILKVLYQEDYSRMTVAVTCRSGLFSLENEEFQKSLMDCRRSPKFYDVKITVDGLGLKDQKKMIEKFCSAERATAVIEEIEKLPNSTSKILQSPLLLLCMVNFAEINFQSLLQSDLTEVYKSLFNNIFKSNILRSGTKIADDFDLFDNSNETSKPYRTMLVSFGKICLKKLAEKDYTFEESDLCNEMYSLGLLTKHEKFNSSSDSEFYYESFHLSFLEFAVAYSVWIKFLDKCRFLDWRPLRHLLQVCTKNEMLSLETIFRNSFGTSLLFSFMLDLLGKHANHLLKRLTQSGRMFSSHEELWERIAMCRGSKDLLQTLIGFIPIRIDLRTNLTSSLQDFFCSKEFEYVIEKAVNSGKLQCLAVDSSAIFSWPNGVTIPKLIVDFGELYELNVDTSHKDDFRGVKYSEVEFLGIEDGMTLWKAVQKIIGSKDLMQAFIPYIPSQIYLRTTQTSSLQDFFCSKEFEYVIEQAVNSGKLQCLSVDSTAVFSWPQNVTIPELIVHFDELDETPIDPSANNDFRRVKYLKLKSGGVENQIKFWKYVEKFRQSKHLLQILSAYISSTLCLTPTLTSALPEFFCSKDFEYVIEQTVNRGNLKILDVAIDAIFSWPNGVTIPKVIVEFGELEEPNVDTSHTDDFRRVKYSEMVFVGYKNEINFWKAVQRFRDDRKFLKSLIELQKHPITISDSLASSMEKFFCSADFENIIREWIQTGVLMSMEIDCSVSFNFPSDIKIPTLFIRANPSSMNSLLRKQKCNFHQVQCDALKLTVYDRQDESVEFEVENLFSDMQDSAADTIILFLNISVSSSDALLEKVLRSLKHGVLKNTKFSSVNVSTPSVIPKDVIYDLLIRNKIAELNINLLNSYYTGSLALSMFRDCNSLVSLSMISFLSKTVRLNFHTLTNGGTRPWKRLNLKNFVLFCDHASCIFCKKYCIERSFRGSFSWKENKLQYSPEVQVFEKPSKFDLIFNTLL